MADRSDNTLRREFIGLGLTGTMVGLAGCSDSINIETGGGGDDSTDGGSGGSSDRNVNLDTASFSFSYDDNAQQVSIEFTGGADIAAGDLQIRQDGGKRVQWAELGSTTTGPDEIIDSGSTATLGSNILNWETQISAEDTIRLVYTGKETPATLERYSPPEDTDTNTTVPASISEFTLESQSEQQLYISFIADKQLETIEVSITGAESRILQMADFTESQTGSGSYTYEATISVAAEGSYTATLEQAVDINGNDSTSGQSLTATTDLTTETEDTTPPTIDAFSIANPSGQQLRVSFESNEELASIQVSISGPESTELNESDFSQTETGNEKLSYEETFQASSDGEYTATLEEAADQNENDGSSGQLVTVSVQTIDSDMVLSFEDGNVGDTSPPSPWYELDNYGGEIRITDERATNGTNSLYIAGEGGGTNDNAQRDINIAVDIDTTNIAEIRVDTFVEQNSNSSGELQAHLIEDGNYTGNQIMGWTQNSTGWHRDSSADISDVTGDRVFYLHTDGSGNRAYFDNIRFYDENGELLPGSDVLSDTNTDTVVVDDFESTEQLDWGINQGDRSRLEFSEDSAQGDYSLYFRDASGNSTNISRSLDDSQMIKFSFWYKYKSSYNNNFRMFLEDSSGNRVVVFQEANSAIRYWDPQKEGEFIKNTEIAQADQDTWYRVVADEIDYSNNTISISVYTSEGDLVNSVQNVGFWNNSDNISNITINNGLGSDGDPDPLWIDHITYEK